MRIERTDRPNEPMDRRRAARELRLPVEIVKAHLLGKLGAERFLLREEELELEEIAEPQRLLPEFVEGVPDALLAGAEARELGDRTDEEEVDDRVSVVRGRQR